MGVDRRDRQENKSYIKQMSRITGAKCRLCRREQKKLYLKGERCYTEKCSLSRRQNLPGKATSYAPRLSPYGERLREKQKVKRIYGITETQMKNLFERAASSGGDKGLTLLQLLERRLDNVVYLLGLMPSKQAARQLVSHGKILVNGKKMDVPSYEVGIGDKVEVADPKAIRGAAPELRTPSWIKKNSKGGEIVGEPIRTDIDEEIKEYLIIEFYSR